MRVINRNVRRKPDMEYMISNWASVFGFLPYKTEGKGEFLQMS